MQLLQAIELVNVFVTGFLPFFPVSVVLLHPNIDSVDSEILCMNEGGSNIPCYENFPKYTLGKRVPARGAAYSKMLLHQAINPDNTNVTKEDINFYLIHTGSKKIINAV